MSYSDSTGWLTSTAQAFTIFGELPPVTLSVPILPPFIFGLIAQGAKFPEILGYAAQILQTGLNFNTFEQYAQIFRNTSAQCGVDLYSLQESMRQLPDFYNSISNAMPAERGTLEKMQTITPAVWTEALCAVVSDARIQAIYPGIQNKIIFGQSLNENPVAVQQGGAAGIDPLPIIKEILYGLATIAGLGGTIVLAVAGIIGIVIGGAAALAVTITAGWVIAAIVITILGIVILGLAIVLVVAALIIAIVMAVKGTDKELLELHRKFIQSMSAMNVHYALPSGS